MNAETLAPPAAGAARGATPAAASTGTSGAYPVAMDREFIERNQIIERYLAGKLPVKGASDFERFCREHPELLDELGMPARVQAAVRLLESGNRGIFEEKPKPLWEKPALPIALGVATLLLAGLAAWLASVSSERAARIAALETLVVEQPLDAATRTRPITVIPNRTGVPRAPLFGMSAEPAELVEMKLDVSWAQTPSFRVSIDRRDHGRVAVLHNLLRDSNGNLRVSVNSAALGPGTYEMTIDALNWRGQPEPAAWASFEVAPRATPR